MTASNTVSELTIEAEVKQIFIDAGWATAPFMSVKACCSGGSMWRSGTPTGMYQIDVWGARHGRQSRDRSHMFRTTKAGAVPAAKITEFAVQRLAIEIRIKEAEQVRTEAVQSNTAVAEQLREYAKSVTGSYYSSYSSQYGGSITEDSGVVGKVKVNVGNLILTDEQARKLLDLLGEFK